MQGFRAQTRKLGLALPSYRSFAHIITKRLPYMLPCYIPTFLFDVTIRHTSTEANVTTCSWVSMSTFRDGLERHLRYRLNKSNQISQRLTQSAWPFQLIRYCPSCLPKVRKKGEADGVASSNVYRTPILYHVN